MQVLKTGDEIFEVSYGVCVCVCVCVYVYVYYMTVKPPRKCEKQVNKV